MTDKYPFVLRVSGLPFMLQGWNNIYVRSDSSCQYESPIYHLQNYTLYNVINIIGVTIKKKDDKWIFYRDCDGEDCPFYTNNEDLLGQWAHGPFISSDVSLKGLTTFDFSSVSRFVWIFPVMYMGYLLNYFVNKK